MRVELPVDYLGELWPREFRGVRLGALLHPASVNSKLEHTSELLERENGKLFQLRAYFGPQHGYRGETQDNMVEWRELRSSPARDSCLLRMANKGSPRGGCSWILMYC